MAPEDPRILDRVREDAAAPSDDLYDCEGCGVLVESVVNVPTQDGQGQFLCPECEELCEMNWTDEKGPDMVWLGPIKGRPGIRP